MGNKSDKDSRTEIYDQCEKMSKDIFSNETSSFDTDTETDKKETVTFTYSGIYEPEEINKINTDFNEVVKSESKKYITATDNINESAVIDCPVCEELNANMGVTYSKSSQDKVGEVEDDSNDESLTEDMLAHVCEDIEKQATTIRNCLTPYIKQQSRLQRKLNRRSNDLGLLYQKSFELRQKISTIQQMKSNVYLKNMYDNAVHSNFDKAESMEHLKIRKRALELLMVKVNDRLQTLKKVNKEQSTLPPIPTMAKARDSSSDICSSDEYS